MGLPWREHPAWSIVERAESALSEPLRPLLLDAPATTLARTREAQLAVLLTSLVAWESAAPVVHEHHEVVAFAGHSLGQVTALIAAGALTLEAGVRLAARRAELTQAAADAHPGCMAALLGATPDQAEAACAGTPRACWLANDNAPGQVVIAGTPDGVDAAVARAKDLGVKRAIRLEVGGAFHTPLMQSARDGLAAVLAEIPFAAPLAPVVSNDDAATYADADGEGWRERLAAHVAVPVRWRESMECMAALGSEAFLEIGHGSMIAGVAKRTLPGFPVYGIASPTDVRGLPVRGAAAAKAREQD